KLIATHGGKYYPEVPMSISYNLWFIQDGQLPAGSVRRYHEDVDWVYHQAGAALSPQQVTAEVAKLRHTHVTYRDTVPPQTPPLAPRGNPRRSTRPATSEGAVSVPRPRVHAARGIPAAREGVRISV